MDEKKIPASLMFKSAATSGAILGLISIVFTVIAYVTGLIYQTSNWLNWVSMVVVIVGLYYFTVKYRNAVCEGYISYGNAMLYGWVTYIFVGIISVFFMVILQTIIEPNFMEKVMEIQREEFYAQGMNDAQVDAVFEMSKKFRSPAMTAIFGFIGSVVLGLVISLITAIFAKKNKPVFL